MKRALFVVLGCAVVAVLAASVQAHKEHNLDEIFGQSALDNVLRPIFDELAVDRSLQKRWKRNTVAGDISKATCGTDEIFKTLPEGIAMENAKKRNVENPTTQAHPEKRASTAGWAPIRIGVDIRAITNGDSRACTKTGYNSVSGLSCTQEDILDAELTELLTKYIIPAAVGVIEATIGVEPVQGNLLLDDEYYDDANVKTCGYGRIPIPTGYVRGKGAGLAGADYYASFSAQPYENGNVLASAGPCNLPFVGNKFGRPLAGGINIAPRYARQVDTTEFYSFRKYVLVIVHEFIHAMGFLEDLYDSFVDLNGQFYTQPTTTVSERGTSVTRLRTPHLTSYARSHFGCSSLTGMEIENNGGSGTVGSHFEQRLAINEMMAGVQVWGTSLTNMTLAFLLDSGWYAVNFAMAEPFGWGFHKGCSWATAKCNAGYWTGLGEFCTVDKQEGCTYDRKGSGYCYARAHDSDLPSAFQYFSGQPKVGGPIETADYCTLTYPYSNTHCQDTKAEIFDESYHGLDSRCLSITNPADSTAAAGCYRVRCQSTILQVFFRGNWTNCPADGSFVAAGTPAYKFHCPSSAENFCVERSTPAALAGSPVIDAPAYDFGPVTLLYASASTMQVALATVVVLGAVVLAL